MFCGQERFFRCGRLHFLVQKNFGFFEIYGVSTRTKRVEPVQNFVDKGGRGQLFAILCRRPLWPASNVKLDALGSDFFFNSFYQS